MLIVELQRFASIEHALESHKSLVHEIIVLYNAVFRYIESFLIVNFQINHIITVLL